MGNMLAEKIKRLHDPSEIDVVVPVRKHTQGRTRGSSSSTGGTLTRWLAG